MSFYQIIANSLSKDKQSFGQNLVIGHINSEQIGDKYVYIIRFDDNIDCNQPVIDCSLQSVSKSNLDFKRDLSFDIEGIADLEQQIIESNNCNISLSYGKQISGSYKTIKERNNSSAEPLIGESSANNGLTCDEEMIDETDAPFDSISDQLIDKTEEDVNRVKPSSRASPVRPFVCLWPQCHKRFTKKCILITHMRTHTNERPFRCDWTNCGKRFNQICVLKNHRRTHTGERPYVCDFADCGLRYKTSGSLHHHRLSHEKPLNKINAKISTNISKSVNILNNSNPNKEIKRSVETMKNSIELHSSDASNDSDSDKYIVSSELSESGEEKNTYECNFGDCGQKFARKCALINHFNYRHSEDSDY